MAQLCLWKKLKWASSEKKIAIDCNGLSLLIFEEKCPKYTSGPKSAPNSDSFWVHRLLYACGLSVPQMRPFCLFTYPPGSKWASSEKMIFLPKSASSVSRSQAHFLTLFNRSFGRRMKLIICQIRHKLSVTTHEISSSWKKALCSGFYTSQQINKFGKISRSISFIAVLNFPPCTYLRGVFKGEKTYSK